jgi:hypothetical protein
MTTTVGVFHADFAQPSSGFRAGTTALSVYANVVPVVLPPLVSTRAAVAALTHPQTYGSLLTALLAQGWQDQNYLFENGSWWELTDILGTRGRQLAPPVDEPKTEDEPEVEMTTDKQMEKIYNVTKCHVFDHDREALRSAGEKATVEEASELLDYIFREVKSRKLAEQLAETQQYAFQSQGRR